MPHFIQFHRADPDVPGFSGSSDGDNFPGYSPHPFQNRDITDSENSADGAKPQPLQIHVQSQSFDFLRFSSGFGAGEVVAAVFALSSLQSLHEAVLDEFCAVASGTGSHCVFKFEGRSNLNRGELTECFYDTISINS